MSSLANSNSVANLDQAANVDQFPNKGLFDIFSRLREHVLTETDSGKQYKLKTYAAVLGYLQRHPKPIRTEADAIEFAQTYDGVGKGTLARIIEFLQTGKLAELENLPEENPTYVDLAKLFKKELKVNDAIASELIRLNYKSIAEIPESILEYLRVFALYTSIYAVGEVTANAWYALGCRTINDVKTDPRITLKENQKIGIEFREQLIAPIPRAEIDHFNTYLHSQLDGIIKFDICGSYIRGRPYSGDIDLLIQNGPPLPGGAAPINYILDLLGVNLPLASRQARGPPYIAHVLKHGAKKIEAICILEAIHRRIDIEIAQPEEYPFAKIYFTGPKEYNEYTRSVAIRLGGKLTEKGLTTSNGQHLYASSEEQVFQFLQLPYLTPQQRDAYSTKKY